MSSPSAASESPARTVIRPATAKILCNELSATLQLVAGVFLPCQKAGIDCVHNQSVHYRIGTGRVNYLAGMNEA